ncbi:MAG: prolyl oligopeptidase family serine peptidase, partial [Planctomycetota bacterium]|nr:prolyl oligopeptidase family serine peptidase [Planctomycetota bacterium]
IAGPAHVKTLLESLPSHLETVFNQRVGLLEEASFLDAISPLSRADAIVKPLLIGQGQHDSRVKAEEIRHIVNSMQARSIPVTYISFPDEGHGFARSVNNLAFLAITEAFLSQHLGGYRQPIENEVRDSSAEIPAGAGQVPGLSEAMR